MIKIRIMCDDGTSFHQRNDRVYDYYTEKELSDSQIDILKAKDRTHETTITKIMEAYQEYLIFGR